MNSFPTSVPTESAAHTADEHRSDLRRLSVVVIKAVYTSTDNIINTTICAVCRRVSNTVMYYVCPGSSNSLSTKCVSVSLSFVVAVSS